MLALKYLLMFLGLVMFGSAGALVAYDILLAAQIRRLLGQRTKSESAAELKVPNSNLFAAAGSRRRVLAAVRGKGPGTFCPGHLRCRPVRESVAVNGTRGRVDSTPGAKAPKQSGDPLPGGADIDKPEREIENQKNLPASAPVEFDHFAHPGARVEAGAERQTGRLGF